MRPLYRIPENQAPKKSLDSNTGLWFERFFNQYDREANKILEPTPNNKNQGKSFWLQQINSAGSKEALQDAAHRQMSLVDKLKGRHKFFNTQWHFVTGTGYPHPVENGLSWHPVHGVPYLTGAAVKGLVRAWVEQWKFAEAAGGDQEAQKRELLLAWFGSDDKDAKKQNAPARAGDLIFFDALPVNAVKLVTDIMTPHQGKWYSEGGNIKDAAKEPEKLPADWHDPVPIPFLAVDQATAYLFSVAPRNAQAAKRVDMDEVVQCLTDALEWLGAGAKTATGYGQMAFAPKIQKDMDNQWETKKQQAQEEQQKAQDAQNFADEIKDLSSLAQRYFTQIKQQDWQNDKNAFWQPGRVEHWLDALVSEPEPAIIDSIKELLNKHFIGLLADPEKVRGKKKEAVFNERQKGIAHRVNKL